jgi:hypothetical protein
VKTFAIACALSLLGTSALAGEVVYRDQNGLPRCIENAGQSVLVVWDHLVTKSSRPVFGITLSAYMQENKQMLNSCRDWPYAVAWPEGVRLISDFSADYSEALQFDLLQIAEGAQVLRTEKNAEAFIATHAGQFQGRRPVEFAQMELDYGTKFSDSLVQSWISQLLHTRDLNPRNCAALIGTCDYYLCVEANHQCGVGGYPVGYGYKYCNRSLFGLLQEMQSEVGRQWVVKTVRCLQTKLNGEFGAGRGAQAEDAAGAGVSSESRVTWGAMAMSCDQIRQTALDSHPDCYVDSGFCEMPMADKMKIFNTVKSELLSSSTVSQATKTLSRCAGASTSPAVSSQSASDAAVATP